MDIYTVHAFEENDSIRLIFDKHRLVRQLVDLYKKMDVNIKSIATGYNVNTYEKELITSILTDTTLSTKNANDPYSKINDIIDGVMRLYDVKHELTVNTDNALTLNIVDPIDSTSECRKKLGLSASYKIAIGRTPDLIDSHKEEKGMPLQLPPRLFEQSRYQSHEYESVYTMKVSVEPSCFENEFTSVMDEVKREISQKQKQGEKYIGIIYNTIYECVLVCNLTPELRQIVREFPDFKLMREYTNLSSTSTDMITTYFLNNMYCDIETVTKKIDAFESLYDLTKNPLEEEKTLILYYINNYYNISRSVDKRIKVSVLLEEVEKELKLKSSSNLKYRFASILAELGLQKKRYSDGMYIYGIESKAMSKVRGDHEQKLSEHDIDTYMAKRDEELKRPLICESTLKQNK